MPTQRYDRKSGVFVLSEIGQAVTFDPAIRVIGVHSAESHGDLAQTAHACEYVGDVAHCDNCGAILVPSS